MSQNQRFEHSLCWSVEVFHSPHPEHHKTTLSPVALSHDEGHALYVILPGRADDGSALVLHRMLRPVLTIESDDEPEVMARGLGATEDGLPMLGEHDAEIWVLSPVRVRE